jgi:hypothetical protein
VRTILIVKVIGGICISDANEERSVPGTACTGRGARPGTVGELEEDARHGVWRAIVAGVSYIKISEAAGTAQK